MPVHNGCNTQGETLIKTCGNKMVVFFTLIASKAFALSNLKESYIYSH